MLLSLPQDIERRRRIWLLLADPLINVVLDEGTLDSDYFRIGRLATEMGYSKEDVKRIFWKEVVPGVAGTWFWNDLLSPGWLEQRIRHPSKLGCLMTFLLCPWWIWITWQEWRSIRKGITAARTSKDEIPTDQFALNKELDHGH